jgi:hypothetical protein
VGATLLPEHSFIPKETSHDDSLEDFDMTGEDDYEEIEG